ncbi:hypothetical protein HHX48_01750 [Salinimonas sp. HHU 13199]|uniref:YtkA-like domain-containing protein n=1 Tax=Salinimonas profundi TaxID=2729140 RepID=A0ABR8LFZ2_9ALTE|nr:hypothetical protein [Salinimonas profundi]MBD3584453.1 hypothetical protein [Salinimonas profundi]
MNKLSRSSRVIISVFIAAAALSVIAMWMLSSKAPVSSCVVDTTSCGIDTAGGSLNIELDMQPAPEEQINFTLITPAPFHVEDIVLEGDEMYMGKVPVFVKSNEDNVIEGWFMLGSCSQVSMRWRMQIKIKGHKDPFTVYLDV